MFLVLSVVCIVLILSSLFSGVRQLFSIFHSFDYPFGISWLNIKYGSKNPDTFIWKILLNNWIWYQALIKDIQKASNKNKIIEEKKRKFWNLSTIIFLFLTSWQIKRHCSFQCLWLHLHCKFLNIINYSRKHSLAADMNRKQTKNWWPLP